MRWAAFSGLGFVFVFILIVLGPIIWRGWSALDWSYLTSDPEVMGRAGGIAPMLYTSLLLNGVALMVTVFFGLPVALQLARPAANRNFVNKGLRLSLDLLAGTPSIVFGLFGHVFFTQWLGLGYSVLSGALTLTLMILPLFIRLVEDALLEIPDEFRLIAKSLSLSEVTLTFRILLPAVWAPLTAALVLSWTRALGETAALLFTSGYSMSWPESIFESGRALSVHIFDLSLNISGADQMAHQAAFALLLFTVFFVVICRGIMKGLVRWKLKHQN